MAKLAIVEDQKQALEHFLSENPQADIISTYLGFIEKAFNVQPVIYPPSKIIFKNAEQAVAALEKEGALWKETEIKIGSEDEGINEETKRIYICPFTGVVFGDNTHPNPQDAIYDWVAKCPENTERVGGLPAKRFFVSEDPEVIHNYIGKNKPEKAMTKVVFSSALSGRLFNTKDAVIKDFRKNYLKPIPLSEVQAQNRFKIEESFLNFIQEQLEETKIAGFVEAIAEIETLQPHVSRWLGN